MHFLTTLSSALLAVPVIQAVELKLYHDMMADTCGGSYASCQDIASDVCCTYTSSFFSVEGTGLDTTGVPDVVAAFTGSVGTCGTSCDSGGGDSSECVDCDDDSLSGADWYVFNDKRDISSPLTTVMADCIGLFDTALGSYRVFSIADGVPAVVVAELDAAWKNNTKVEDLSGVAVAFEI